MPLRVLPVLLGLGTAVASAPADEPLYRQFRDPPHQYFERTPTDRFTQFAARLESGDVPLPRGDERNFLVALLEALEIPVSSQLLVFSTTSLQLSRISPSSPRALYFNDEIYLGYVQGGRIEVAALDRDLGVVFHIFDIPRGPDPIRVERATRCMNCHAGDETGFIPGLLVKSVAAGASGGSLDAFRRALSGHAIPWAERFGGWHVTGADAFTNHWGNAQGRFADGELQRTPLPPGARFSFTPYPATTSDFLAHALHEHQVGFVNRAVEALYRTRAALHLGNGTVPEGSRQELETAATALARYLLFADEVPLPPGGIAGDAAFKADFARGRKAWNGVSLRDLDLRSRLLAHRCSYMIYSSLFEGLPGAMKSRVFAHLRAALAADGPSVEGAHLPAAERAVLRDLLAATVPGYSP